MAEEPPSPVNSSSPAEHPSSVNSSSPAEEHPSQSPGIFGKNLLLLFIIKPFMLLGLSTDFSPFICMSLEKPEHRDILDIKSIFRATFLPAIFIFQKAYNCKG